MAYSNALTDSKQTTLISTHQRINKNGKFQITKVKNKFTNGKNESSNKCVEDR